MRINKSQSLPRARPRSIRHKLASDMRRDAPLIDTCVECLLVTIEKPTIRKTIPINGLRHRTRILAHETPCVALLRITT